MDKVIKCCGKAGKILTKDAVFVENGKQQIKEWVEQRAQLYRQIEKLDFKIGYKFAQISKHSMLELK